MGILGDLFGNSKIKEFKNKFIKVYNLLSNISYGGMPRDIGLQKADLDPESWQYCDTANKTLHAHTDWGKTDYRAEATAGDGYEGYEVGANVTLAKNIVAGVKYFDLEQREGSKDAQTLWSEVIFTF